MLVDFDSLSKIYLNNEIPRVKIIVNYREDLEQLFEKEIQDNFIQNNVDSLVLQVVCSNLCVEIHWKTTKVI